MSKARWIWFNGDYELYHTIKLHSRRQEFETDCPAMWALYPPYPNVTFVKQWHADEDCTIKVVSNSRGYVVIDGDHSNPYQVNGDIKVKAGDHYIMVRIISVGGLPGIYINSPYLVTDETWSADHCSNNFIPVGCEDAYYEPTDDITVFPFKYQRCETVKRTRTETGMLYDFGKEMFSCLCIEKAVASRPLVITYGESEAEALDHPNALVRETVCGESSYRLVPRAFRYVHIAFDQSAPLTVYADYEYNPIEDVATFECNRAKVKKIWDVCSYTFHLNSREFYLDGIKRDRWVWSGDAYQSYMANLYLYFNPAMTRRTIIALLGKPPYEQHINTINDYSAYLIIGAYDYYYATGDETFVKIYFERLKALYDFIEGRLDENGYVCARHGDWIFIDWSDMDKGGPLCAEQILLWQCRKAMAALAEICGLDSSKYLKDAETLKKKIMRDYWREDRGAFIDCYTTGKENVTRHANIFAIMYDFVSPTRARRIVRSVLENDEVTQITTPYFEFFELCALCKMGKLQFAQKKIESYWGGMVALGATSIWEEFNPNEVGNEHYAMYGKPYGRSLCHAWGSGPIYLLGRYCMGVYPTSVAYKTYRVEPNLGMYKTIKGIVPLPDGDKVSVTIDKNICIVHTTRAGGTFVWKGKEYALEPNKELIITF